MAAPTDVLYDLSPELTPEINVWPGDTPLTREVLCELEKGATVTLSTIRSTVHLGSHADGPNHYLRTGVGVGERPLGHYLGPCHVVHARVAKGARVRTEDVAWPDAKLGVRSLKHPRLLIRTGTFADHRRWNADFAGLDPAMIDELGAMTLGLTTIGLDSPSVDLQDSKDLPAHAACARHDLSIIEGLVLRDVPPGEYELIALPLKLIGCDASPIRAVLRGLR